MGQAQLVEAGHRASPSCSTSRPARVRAPATRHLLAEDGPHPDLEAVPAAGDPQPGARGHQRAQHRVVGEARRRVGLVVEAEHPADLLDDVDQARPSRGGGRCSEQVVRRRRARPR